VICRVSRGRMTTQETVAEGYINFDQLAIKTIAEEMDDILATILRLTELLRSSINKEAERRYAVQIGLESTKLADLILRLNDSPTSLKRARPSSSRG
jgi:hypothetical protein